MWEQFIATVTEVNDFINGLVWGWPMVILILGTGLLLTIRSKVMQVRKFKISVNETIAPTLKSIGKHQPSKSRKENSISQFEAFATAISGTVGTGNIIGVSSAIMTGGPGAVFWMWVSAFFGMITNYSENVLGMYFRKKENGDFSGGPAYYLSEGIALNKKGKLGSFLKGFGKVLGVMAAVFCTFAAIGMSGMQTNKMSGTFQSVFTSADATTVALIVGIIVAVVLALIILGGIKSIGRVTSILVPFMSLIFIGMAVIIIMANISSVTWVFEMIFKNAFSFKSATAGVASYAFGQIIQKGLARGVFSNEAGLGSSVIAHSASETREPVKQGFWGIFEVFFDTFVICTMTAIVVLLAYGKNEVALYGGGFIDTQISMMSFEQTYGMFGRVVYSTIIPLFAFTTILAWAYYGEKSVDFLFRKTGMKGRKIATTVFKVLYVLLVIVSALIDGELAWAISDTCNGLMALPNLIGLVFMSGLVVEISKNYFQRKKGMDVEPMLSAYPEQNEQFKQDLIIEQAEAVEDAEAFDDQSW